MIQNSHRPFHRDFDHLLNAHTTRNAPTSGRSKGFAEITGARLKTLKRGGHITTDSITRKYWAEIKKFFDSARD